MAVDLALEAGEIVDLPLLDMLSVGIKIGIYAASIVDNLAQHLIRLVSNILHLCNLKAKQIGPSSTGAELANRDSLFHTDNLL